MNSPSNKRSLRQAWTDWLVILVFAVLLWMPTADYFGHVDWTRQPDENRMMAPQPRLARLDVSGVRDYLAACEACFNDHFGFRKRLIRWSQQWRERLFRSKSFNLVITGQNGWYYIAERQMIDHYLGLRQFTPQELRAWQRLLEKRRDWLAARGIKYLFVVPPDKQTIYPENLPAWLVKATPAVRRTKLDQFMEYMKAHSTVQVLDLRQPLLAGKKIAPTYLQNDTHWNEFGGFLGAQELVKALARQEPGLPPLRLEDFDWTNTPHLGGDMATLIGVQPPEHNYFVFAPKPPLLALQNREITDIVRNWNPHDPAKVNRLVENPNPLAAPVDLVMFHDSYAKAWWSLLGFSFHRIVFVWDDKEFNVKVIEKYHPQIVVNEMLERMFNSEDPDEMYVMEALQ